MASQSPYPELFTPLLHASWYTDAGSIRCDRITGRETREMKKKLFVIAIAALVCILFTGIASAEYGYTRVSELPMAVDFTYSVEIEEDETPCLETDYPFEETGAMQMILVYSAERLGNLL